MDKKLEVVKLDEAKSNNGNKFDDDIVALCEINVEI